MNSQRTQHSIDNILAKDEPLRIWYYVSHTESMVSTLSDNFYRTREQAIDEMISEIQQLFDEETIEQDLVGLFEGYKYNDDDVNIILYQLHRDGLSELYDADIKTLKERIFDRYKNKLDVTGKVKVADEYYKIKSKLLI